MAVRLTANVRPTIAEVKSSAPPSNPAATAKSAISHAAKAAPKAMTAANDTIASAEAERGPARATPVASSATTPRAAPQAKLFAVQG